MNYRTILAMLLFLGTGFPSSASGYQDHFAEGEQDQISTQTDNSNIPDSLHSQALDTLVLGLEDSLAAPPPERRNLLFNLVQPLILTTLLGGILLLLFTQRGR